jgi:hypothetical protein
MRHIASASAPGRHWCAPVGGAQRAAWTGGQHLTDRRAARQRSAAGAHPAVVAGAGAQLRRRQLSKVRQHARAPAAGLHAPVHHRPQGRQRVGAGACRDGWWGWRLGWRLGWLCAGRWAPSEGGDLRYSAAAAPPGAAARASPQALAQPARSPAAAHPPAAPRPLPRRRRACAPCAAPAAPARTPACACLCGSTAAGSGRAARRAPRARSPGKSPPASAAG